MYDDGINEYLSLGHMYLVPAPKGGSESCFYLPHHGVYKPDSVSTKLRVVFSASCPSANGKRLNDLLYVGPVLQKDIVTLVLNWRLYRFVFNADITKMYRQILVNPEHARYQKILYRSDPDSEIRDCQLKTVTFGVNCAPYLALRTLLQLADDEERKFPLGSRVLRNNMYVEDALAGAHSVSEAICARKELDGILLSGGFELRKWTSNAKQILEDLPRDNLLCEDFLDFDDKSSAKTLGIRWNAKTDSFYFVSEKLKNKETFTKREVLSIIARLFDPLGWLSPVIVTAKILMQQLWLDKTGWDDSLKQLSPIKWRQFIRSYVDIDKINIPRWIRYTADSEIEFHGFCDSSELAYAAVLYARVKWGSEIHTSLLVSKSRVAPIKKLSLPRLELCGALLLAELINVFLPQMDVTNRPLYLWSDSTIVLAWLKKPSHTWTTFVANRVAKIQDIVGGCWRHVSTYDNPADLATRRVTPAELKDNALWRSGQSWLKDEDRLWPGSRTIPETNIEAKPLQVHVDRLAELDDMLERFSCLSRALHVIAYMFRFFHATHPASRGRIKYDTLRLTSNELHPFILSPTSWFAKLYIRFIHRLTLHGGPQLMLATIRLECWILKAKHVIKSCVRSCKECVLARRSKQVQIMAALPPERITFSRPFANTGVDFAGPFDLKNFAGRGCRITKGYICLYVCFATKAIHLEAVSDLSTPDFLAALTRFVSRRGCPNRIYSDNGRNFVGAAKEIKANLRKSLAELKSEATLRYGHQSLEWHFIPADAPHMGGLWRRLKQVQQEFCRRWKSDYLKELHKRNKWQRPSVDLKLGDMVVLRQEPGWRLGRVIKLYSGSDGHVRVVDLRTAAGVITRPIHKLVLYGLLPGRLSLPPMDTRHSLRLCRRFLVLPPTEKARYVAKNEVCENFLAISYQIDKCKSRPCRTCWFGHHTILHPVDERKFQWMEMTALVSMRRTRIKEEPRVVRVLMDPNTPTSYFHVTNHYLPTVFEAEKEYPTEFILIDRHNAIKKAVGLGVRPNRHNNTAVAIQTESNKKQNSSFRGKGRGTLWNRPITRNVNKMVFQENNNVGLPGTPIQILDKPTGNLELSTPTRISASEGNQIQTNTSTISLEIVLLDIFRI
ncbi:uncharacterized protein LOC142235462 [Haematobia irritans]|uniref:uncharacterized protein LOC142235462 n=1 Tax=Haematobia irritans TaxID=7368 RepID=UPI003F501FF7